MIQYCETIRPLPMAAIVYLAFEPAWLALSRQERGEIAGQIATILARHPGVAFEWYDADALAGGYSDFAICRFSDMRAYHHLWEELRDTVIFSKPYARIVNVTTGIENGFQDYEANLQSAAVAEAGDA
ncbi:darcynin family protein [Roseibium aggregatum]|uniref:darcynin family protein n=1 Tax=Roseibium aggregatum TaxID=187304 RepID=UPI001E3220A1|nr:darcynin family protein [Roseibium aggregatum]UES50110.1 Darcynin 2 [Roseibium aggregatum]